MPCKVASSLALSHTFDSVYWTVNYISIIDAYVTLIISRGPFCLGIAGNCTDYVLLKSSCHRDTSGVWSARLTKKNS